MSTPNVAPTTTTVTVTTTPKLVAGVKALIQAQATVSGKFQALADLCREASTSKGYDRKQSGEMLKLAFIEAGEDEQKSSPDRSKVLSLAYPATEESAKALAEAKAHNATATAAQKIGVNDQLKIARDKTGATTVASILEERANKSAERGAQNGGAPRIPSSTPASPTAFDLDAEKKALMHVITRLRTVGKLTEEQVDTIIADIVTEYNAAVAAE